VNGVAVSNTVLLVGPGDILGINPRVVVRTEPRNWITDFEHNYLPFIEFYDEEFTWRYTPATATGHRLRPWIFLLALTESEFERKKDQPGPLPAVTLKGDVSKLFPEAGQTWAWAHVHAGKDVTNLRERSPDEAVDALEVVLAENPDNACSRLLCPRKLKPNTAYYAFVIPAFETGRLAGLGQPTTNVDALKASWGDGQTDYPVYYEWFFRTGTGGDFEYLVDLLEPRPVDDRVGIRDMDMQSPEFGVPGLTDPPVMGLEGALKKPGGVPRPPAWPPDPPPPFLTRLAERVNAQAALLEPPAEGTAHPDPIISPPLYGRWHAKVDRLAIAGAGWVNELNRDPRLRVPAGFGTRVIQANQEDYMQRAWEQLGDVLEANQKIRQAQLSLSACHQLWVKSLLSLSSDQLVAATQAVHARVLASPVTIHKHILDSRLPAAALKPAFRRITRPRGVVMRKALPESGRKQTDMILRLNDGRLAAAPPKVAPAKQISLTAAADSLVPSWLPKWLWKLFPRTLWQWLAWLVLLAAMSVVAGSAGLLVEALVVLGGVVAAGAWLRPRIMAAEALEEEGLTPERVESVPPRPGFVVSEAGVVPPAVPPTSAGADSIEARHFRLALTHLHRSFQLRLPRPPMKLPLDVPGTAQLLAQGLNPARTIPLRIRGVVAIPPGFTPLRPTTTIVPIMAHPVFRDPMYAPLRDLSSELLIPNLNLIPDNTISLLETNRPWVEAYMVGVNHEMSRELLWREYLTDMRGSYFRQFWDVGDVVNRDPTKSAAQWEEELRDIRPIHLWDRATALGVHENRDLPSGSELGEARLVVVIRGQLLKKYPTTIVFAQKAKWGKDELQRDIRELDRSTPEVNVREPLFKAEIEPDLQFIGLNLTAGEARGSANVADADPGWFIVLQERPGEPRFGLDLSDNTPKVPTKWDDLAWEHLGALHALNYIDLAQAPTTSIAPGPDEDIAWGRDAADMAYVLYQVPVMVAFHAHDMLE